MARLLCLHCHRSTEGQPGVRLACPFCWEQHVLSELQLASLHPLRWVRLRRVNKWVSAVLPPVEPPERAIGYISTKESR